MNLVLVGGGNMARALITGLVRGTGQPAHRIAVIEPDAERRAALQRDLGVSAVAAAEAAQGALHDAEVVVLAIKPQQAHAACTALVPWLGAAVVLSIVAGIRIGDLRRWLPGARIVRAMPNTPALIGAGITGMAVGGALDDPPDAAQRSAAAQVMGGAGGVIWFDDEAQLDTVTAISGSGPAYVFYFIEALQQAGRELGLAPAQARELAVATFSGAIRLAEQSGTPVESLRAEVTSKGGTTAAALEQLDADQVRDSIVRAVRRAQRRAAELGDEFGAV